MKSNHYSNSSAQKNIEKTNLLQENILKLFIKNSLKTFFFCFLYLFAITGTVMAQVTYIWNGATSDFQLASNWTPNRTVLNVGDSLIFQNITQTVMNVPAQTIAVIILKNVGGAAVVTLLPAGTNTLTLTGASTIAATCSLTVSNNMTISNSGTITVYGFLDFNGAIATPQVCPAGIIVNSGGELRFDGAGAPVFSATPAAAIASGGTLTIAATISASTGTALPTYAGGATLQYKVSGNVNTGVELPVFPASIDNLVISNVGSNNQVKLLSSVTVTGTNTGLNITNGILTLNGKTLTVTGVANGVSGMGRIFVDAAATLAFTGNNAGAIGTLYFVSTSLGTMILNRTGAGAELTIGSVLKISNTLTLSNGIINVADGFTLTYSGAAGNLSSGSATSYVSFLNSAPINYGFRLGDGLTNMNAATYTLPIGTTTTTGNPAVSGYRPVQITWGTATTNYFYIGLMNDTGISSSPGRLTDVPSAGNNRAGYIASISTNDTSYGLSMSYSNSDFNASTPVIKNVAIFNWGGSVWKPNLQTGSTSGTPNFITDSAFTIESGTLALGVLGGADLPVAVNNFSKSGSAMVTIYPNPAFDKIYFTSSQTYGSNPTLHIIDMNGREAIAPAIIKVDEGNPVSFDVSSLAKGIYVIRLISDSSIEQAKLVKQ